MISATSIKHPLPIRPVDGLRPAAAESQRPARGGRLMQPLGGHLPVDASNGPDLTGAIRDVAFERMMTRLGVMNPLPVIDPTA